MRAIVQRVSTANVVSDGNLTGEIKQGFVVLLGIEHEDLNEDANWLVDKIIKLRVFQDDADKMNLSLLDVDGELLVISQFTLHASTKKGNRPSFIQAARPEQAVPLYEYFIDQIQIAAGKPVQTGIFGAHMNVSLINDGPVTLILDSKKRE